MRWIAFLACAAFACSSPSTGDPSFEGDGDGDVTDPLESGGAAGDGGSPLGDGGGQSDTGGTSHSDGGSTGGDMNASGGAESGGSPADGGSQADTSGGAPTSGGTSSGGAPIEECPLWYADFDGDGFGDPDVSEESCSPVSGYVQNADDCYDGNDFAFPRDSGASVSGVPAWFLEDRGDGSFDYDCDGEITLQHNYGNCPDGEVTNGWAFAAPECGGEAGWKSSCSLGGSVFPREQGCR